MELIALKHITKMNIVRIADRGCRGLIGAKERSDTMKEKLKEYGVLVLLLIAMVLGFIALSVAFRDLFAMMCGVSV